MIETLIKAIINLLKIKSLMTIAVMIVFVKLSLEGKLEPTLTAAIITAVITYYFNKKEKEGNDDNI